MRRIPFPASAGTLNKPAAADAGSDGNGAVQLVVQQAAQTGEGYAVHGTAPDSSGQRVGRVGADHANLQAELDGDVV